MTKETKVQEKMHGKRRRNMMSSKIDDDDDDDEGTAKTKTNGDQNCERVGRHRSKTASTASHGRELGLGRGVAVAKRRMTHSRHVITYVPPARALRE